MKKKDPTSHRIIEKRRRDRMNNCLADLSRLIPIHYMKKGRGRIEKTEIIEMAIKYLNDLMAATGAHQHQGMQSHHPLSNVEGNTGSGSESASSSGDCLGSNCFSSGSSNSGRSSSSSCSSGSDVNSDSINVNFNNHPIVDCFSNTDRNLESSSTSSRNQVVVWYKKALLVRSISRSPPAR